MTRTETKAEERDFCERMASLCQEFPRGLLVDSESPDFLVMDGEEVALGIEVVGFVRAQGQEGFYDPG